MTARPDRPSRARLEKELRLPNGRERMRGLLQAMQKQASENRAAVAKGEAAIVSIKRDTDRIRAHAEVAENVVADLIEILGEVAV